MRIVLQSNSTSLYFCDYDQWTPRFKQAHDFGSLGNLIEFSRKEKITDVQVVIILEKAEGIEFLPFPIDRLLGNAPAP